MATNPPTHIAWQTSDKSIVSELTSMRFGLSNPETKNSSSRFQKLSRGLKHKPVSSSYNDNHEYYAESPNSLVAISSDSSSSEEVVLTPVGEISCVSSLQEFFMAQANVNSTDNEDLYQPVLAHSPPDPRDAPPPSRSVPSSKPDPEARNSRSNSTPSSLIAVKKEYEADKEESSPISCLSADMPDSITTSTFSREFRADSEIYENPRGMIRSGKSRRKNPAAIIRRHDRKSSNIPNNPEAPSPPLSRSAPVVETTTPSRRNPTTSSNATLDWRMDPSSSLSDWKLQIFNPSTKTFETYHVHRVVLAVGPRACAYFSNAFETGNARGGTTRVPLIAQACPLVPSFLDFLYGQPSFAVTTETALGLAHLAEVFDQAKLRTWIRTFVAKDLNASTVLKYWEDAIYYDHVYYTELVLQIATMELPSLPPSSSLVVSWLKEWSPTHMLHVMEILKRQEETTRISSVTWSQIVAEYCRLHPQKMTSELLHGLAAGWISQDGSPMDPKAAMQLLELELKLSLNENNDTDPPNESRNYDESLRREGQDTTPSVLQRRCLEILSNDWTQLGKMDSPAWKSMLETMAKQSSSGNHPLLSGWIPKLLQRAQDKVADLEQARNASQLRESLLRQELNQVVLENRQTKQDLEQLRKTFKSAKTEMKEQVQGWIRKHDEIKLNHRAQKETWSRQELDWRMQRQKWLHEKGLLQEELAQARLALGEEPEVLSSSRSVNSTSAWYGD